jgi:hypothetical protein
LRLKLVRQFLGTCKRRCRFLDSWAGCVLRAGPDFRLGSLGGLWNDFDPAGTATNDVGSNSALHHRFPSLNLSKVLVPCRHHTVSDDFFFANVHLRLFLSC